MYGCFENTNGGSARGSAALCCLGETRRNVFQAQRGLATSSVLYWNGKTGQDPIQKLFLDKLKEFNTNSKAGQVSMTPEVAKQYKDETERLRRVYGADKEDLSQFPSFKFQ